MVNLTSLAAELLAQARGAKAGRAAHTVRGGHDHALRQTLLALVAGSSLGEHDSPGEATLVVLDGTVELHAGEDSWALQVGDHIAIPDMRHDLSAVTDAAVLLTVVTTPRT